MVKENKIIFLLLLSFSNLSFANCTDSSPNVEVKIISNPPIVVDNVHHDLITSEIGVKTLGKYKSTQDYSMESNLTTTDGLMGLCGNINRLVFSVRLESKILLSSELNSNKCQKEDTLKHEYEHYYLTKKSINDLKPYIYSILKELVDENYRASSLEGIADIVKNKEARATEKISDYVLGKIKALNILMDREDSHNEIINCKD